MFSTTQVLTPVDHAQHSIIIDNTRHASTWHHAMLNATSSSTILDTRSHSIIFNHAWHLVPVARHSTILDHPPYSITPHHTTPHHTRHDSTTLDMARWVSLKDNMSHLATLDESLFTSPSPFTRLYHTRHDWSILHVWHSTLDHVQCSILDTRYSIFDNAAHDISDWDTLGNTGWRHKCRDTRPESIILNNRYRLITPDQTRPCSMFHIPVSSLHTRSHLISLDLTRSLIFHNMGHSTSDSTWHASMSLHAILDTRYSLLDIGYWIRNEPRHDAIFNTWYASILHTQHPTILKLTRSHSILLDPTRSYSMLAHTESHLTRLVHTPHSILDHTRPYSTCFHITPRHATSHHTTPYPILDSP